MWDATNTAQAEVVQNAQVAGGQQSMLSEQMRSMSLPRPPAATPGAAPVQLPPRAGTMQPPRRAAAPPPEEEAVVPIAMAGTPYAVSNAPPPSANPKEWEQRDAVGAREPPDRGPQIRSAAPVAAVPPACRGRPPG